MCSVISNPTNIERKVTAVALMESTISSKLKLMGIPEVARLFSHGRYSQGCDSWTQTETDTRGVNSIRN